MSTQTPTTAKPAVLLLRPLVLGVLLGVLLYAAYLAYGMLP
jgi:hypothetical protein